MSEENPQKPTPEGGDNKELSTPTEGEIFEALINKSKEQLTIKDPSTGRVVTLRAGVEEPDEEEDIDVKPLPPDKFREALQRMDQLGLTWTADSIPRVVTKEGTSEDVLLSEELRSIQETYPALPRELATVVFHALTGVAAHERLVGNKDDLQKKAKAVGELLITPSYRAEFFFKHAIKVPYFEGIDWEVLFKTHERNVEGMPGVAYALLMLTFHNPNPRVSKIDEHQNVTVAVNLTLVDKLIGLLIDVKTALEEAGILADKINERLIGEGHEQRS